MTEGKLMLIDGNSLLYRAFYALPLLHTSGGVYTNGVYGFLTMLNRVITQEQPTHIIVAFDKDRKTFRTQMYSEYKANRSAPPDELRGQFQLLREVLTALNVGFIELEGYEADDIIGTIAKRAEKKGMESIIVTGDNDVLQLVSEKTKVLITKKGISEMELYTPAKVKEKWEVEPEKIVEVRALAGDSSDNIPGVPGIGVKTAVKLIKEYGTLENLYEHCDQLGGEKLVERLKTNKEKAFLSRQLSAIDRDVDLVFQLGNYEVREPDMENLLDIYRRLEFNNLINALQEGDRVRREAAEDKVEVISLESEEAVAAFIGKIAPGDPVAIYVEADYHHPMWAKIQSLFFELKGQIYIFKIDPESHRKLEWIKSLLESDTTAKYLHNAKFVQVILKRYGIYLRGIAGDTMLMAYVDDPSFTGEELSPTIFRYLNINISPNRPDLLVSKIMPLFFALREKISPELRKLLEQVEMPLSDVLACMEFYGIKIAPEILDAISEELTAGIAQVETRIYELAGEIFNINSPKQLGKVLFESLGLRVVKKTKTGYSTGAEVLEELYDDHEIIPYILDYRQLTKLKSTYVDALRDLIHPDTGRVHTIFKQAQTATGRLSSVEPNLQNIPVRGEEGRRIRKAFIAQDDEWLLISADYSQIDLRSLAHISGDKKLIETFEAGIDIHARTASEIFKVPLEEVTSDLRRKAKAVNFGIIYGISDYGLAKNAGVSRQEARRYIDEYLGTYPGVRQYMQDIVEFGEKHGYVETVLKRRRYLPDLKSKNKTVRAFARRMALNTPVQGTSADIIKLAMINIFRELTSKGMKSKLLLQVHDELVLEVPKTELEEAVKLLKQCMENAYSLKVPLKVSIKTGPNWYDMQEWKR
ncbi:MAG: DNA polymerase I [Syntrophomonadaceae bacterium]|nr:DNA polymerase I [Syntrophomonadaceae bacterium]